MSEDEHVNQDLIGMSQGLVLRSMQCRNDSKIRCTHRKIGSNNIFFSSDFVLKDKSFLII